MEFNLNELKVSPQNLEIYNESDNSDLIESIRQYGLLSPIVINQDNFILSGHRRYYSCLHLGFDEVEVEVKEVDEESIPPLHRPFQSISKQGCIGVDSGDHGSHG